jgi:aminoglycoside phosphotransferase
MGQSYSGYLKSVKAVRSVRQIHAITTSICEDPLASAHLKRASAALTRKLERVIDLPVASAPFLASIWRDFRSMREILEKEHGKLDISRPCPGSRLERTRCPKEKGLR